GSRRHHLPLQRMQRSQWIAWLALQKRLQYPVDRVSARQLLATFDGSRLDQLGPQRAPELEAPIDDDPEARGGHGAVSVDAHGSFPPAMRAATGSTSRPRTTYPKTKASMLTTH